MSYLFQTLSVELVEPVLARNRGDVTQTARELGVNSGRLRRYVHKEPELQAVMAEFREQLLDRAEWIMRKALMHGKPTLRDNTARFVLAHLDIATERRLCPSQALDAKVIDIQTRKPITIEWTNNAKSPE